MGFLCIVFLPCRQFLGCNITIITICSRPDILPSLPGQRMSRKYYYIITGFRLFIIRSTCFYLISPLGQQVNLNDRFDNSPRDTEGMLNPHSYIYVEGPGPLRLVMTLRFWSPSLPWCPVQVNTALQSQKAVAAYFWSEQLLPFGFAEQDTASHSVTIRARSTKATTGSRAGVRGLQTR